MNTCIHIYIPLQQIVQVPQSLADEIPKKQ